MKKITLLLAIFFLFLGGKAQVNEAHTITPQAKVLLPPQSDFIGFFSSTYMEYKGEKDPVTIHQPLNIIYNSKDCKLSIGNIVTYFEIDPSYTRELVNGNVVEEFINADAETVVRGWYSIRIVHDKAGTSSVTINLPMIPGGTAYIADAAEKYSENGKVNGKVHVENWKEIEAKASELRAKQAERKRLNDSLVVVARVADSVSNALAEIERKKKIEDGLNSGEFENHEWENRSGRKFEDDLRRALKSKVDYGVDVRININNKGEAIAISKVERRGAFYSGVEGIWDQLLKIAKNTAFPKRTIDGKDYPYYVVVSVYGPASQ